MKKNKVLLGFASVLALFLLIPALLVPTMGATSTLSATNYGFNKQAVGISSTDLRTALGGTTVYPTTATIAPNPTDPTNDSDRVLRVDSKVVDSGTVQDFYADGYAFTITWDDAAKTSGTATNGSLTYDVTSTDGGKTVVSSKNGNTYTVYNDGAIKEAVGGGSNVDKNVTLGNKVMSYETYDKIVLQAEYYIEANSRGSFESQITRYSSTTHSAAAYLNLLKIDLGTGVLTTGFVMKDGKQGSTTLEKEVWNTVSLVIDLDTGAVDYYVNNVLLMEGYFMRDGVVLENLTFNKGCWNIAKMNKQAIGVSGFAGSLYVNNARYHSFSESTKVTLVDDGTLLYADMTLASGREASASPGDTMLVNTNVKYSLVTTDAYADAMAPVKGASIRLTNNTGIRFATQVNTDKINELVQAKAEGKIRNVQIGTLITPYTYVTKAGAFTVDALSTLPYSSKYLDVKCSIGGYYNPGVTLDEGYDTCFVGSITDIKPGNRARLFTAVGYIKVTMNNGTFKYIYSYDYTDATTQEQKYSRSIQYIASVFVNDSRFAAHREVLQSFMEGLTAATGYSTTCVKNVQYSYNEFYFQNAAGVACQLLYDGNNGWRLQAVKPTQTNNKYNEFDTVGAAQALSCYLGEENDDVAMKLSISQSSSKFTVRAEGTDSYVTLNITGSFALQIFSPDGEVMHKINSIEADGSTVTLKGALNDDEAVYGGGETFNAVNKRGQYMSLYSYDAYNAGRVGTANEDGTYTAIPLFTFTRGSGLFVNRYEIMTADWGNTSNGSASSNVWEISIENNLIDCYFYATGNMLDAIYGYTDLAGHATLPEEWAQGVLICRYSPDFASLEGETVVFDSLEDIPGYESLTLTKGGELATTVDNWMAYANKKYTYSGQPLYSGDNAKYRYVVVDGVGQFYRCTKKGGAPMGVGVREIVEGLIEAGMKPTAMVLEGLNWSSIKSAANYQNFIDVINYCEDQGINTMIYMSVGFINSSMPDYKEEYQLHATLTCDLTYTNGQVVDGYTYTHEYVDGEQTTINIPRNAASENPDALGAGSSSYLDITNPDAVDWYMDVVWGQLLEIGVDGAKIDFCEIMPNDGFTFTVTGTKTAEDGTESDVNVGTATMHYQWCDESVFDGNDVHHAYPTYFISLFCQTMNERAPEGFAVLNRGGGIGMQRNPFMWAGDQTRSQLALSTQLTSVLSSGISGLPFMTYDMAGYCYGSESGAVSGYWNKDYQNAAEGAAEAQALESEIFIRAVQYTAFSLTFQTNGDVRHMYELTEEAQKISAQYTDLHNELMPYIRKYSQIACDTGMPVLRLLVLHYQNDANVYDIQDQYMLGDALMVAPILTLDTTKREVYLPEGNWLDLLTGKEYEVGAGGRTITVTAEINQIPVFLNADAEDAGSLSEIFNGELWQSLNGGVKINYAEPGGDPGENDIFQK